MKKLILLIITLFTATIFADPSCCEIVPKDCCEPSCPPCSCDTIPNPCCDFLPPCLNCNLDSDSPKRGVYFQFIFSQPEQDGLAYVVNNSASFGSNGLVAYPEFDWFVGARGGVEYTFCYDRWNLNINGMVINVNSKDRQRQDVVDQTNFNEQSNGKGLIPVWAHPDSYSGNLKGVRYTNANVKWEQQFYALNIMLGKKFCISRKISFLPSFGLSNLIILDTYKARCKDGKIFPIDPSNTTLRPLSSYSRNDQDTFGIGPRVGVDTHWYFFQNANFFAGAYGSLYYSYFYTKRHDINNFQIQSGAPSVDELRLKHDFSSIKPAIELMLGINYEHCIVCKNLTPKLIRFSFGYGIEYIWKQNQFIQFDDAVNDGNFFTLQGDLHMQEINIGVTCLF